ncbi:MAG: hypothetical protein AB7O32_11370 [Vicinamibacterales bacterium]
MTISAWRSVLAYLGPVALVMILWPQRDPEAQWHARQGVVLFVLELALLMTTSVAAGATVLTSFGLGVAMLVALWLVWAAIVLLHFTAAIMAVNGRRLVLPGVSALADRDWRALIVRRRAAVRPR